MKEKKEIHYVVILKFVKYQIKFLKKTINDKDSRLDSYNENKTSEIFEKKSIQ